MKPSIDKDTILKAKVYIEKLAGAEHFEVSENIETENTVAIVCALGEVHIPMGDLIDVEKERIRLNKELETIDSEINRAEGKLNNQGFVAKAPAKLIEEEKNKLLNYKALKEKLVERISALNNIK
jgi:Valyl-tRNA synthetase